MYILNTIDNIFNTSLTENIIKPGDSLSVRILFTPNISGQFTEYYLVDDNEGNSYRLTVTGKCNG